MRELYFKRTVKISLFVLHRKKVGFSGSAFSINLKSSLNHSVMVNGSINTFIVDILVL